MMKRGFFIAILLITVLFIAGCTSYPGDAVGKKLKSSSGDCAGGALPEDDGSCPDDAPTIDKKEMERRQAADLQAIGGSQNLPGTSGYGNNDQFRARISTLSEVSTNGLFSAEFGANPMARIGASINVPTNYGAWGSLSREMENANPLGYSIVTENNERYTFKRANPFGDYEWGVYITRQGAGRDGVADENDAVVEKGFYGIDGMNPFSGNLVIIGGSPALFNGAYGAYSDYIQGVLEDLNGQPF